MTEVAPGIDDFALMDEWGPEKVVCVSDPRLGMRGALVIDNTARGIGKGGTRMTPTVTVNEVARLARVMTWKWAAADLFFGGAKAGIRADPARPDKEPILRSFVRRLANEVPSEYVFGLDMGLTENDAAIIQDELGGRGTVVGTPRALGGIPYDDWGVTGFGVAEAADAAMNHRSHSIDGASVVVQGFGAVGTAAARRLVELGARVVAISNRHGVVHDPDGVNIGEAVAAREALGENFLDEVAAARRLAPGSELQLAADILIPAATQDVIDTYLAQNLAFHVIVEGANLPITPAAQLVLAKRQTTVVPDFIANAGGVVAAAFAMDTRMSAFPTEPEAIFSAITAKIRTNTTHVLDEAARSHETSHVAAQRLAADRVRAAMTLMGRAPAVPVA